MTLKKNIIANYIGQGTVVLASILALPWYLSALGSKLFGLISFVATVQALLGLVDAGMSQALIREFTVRLNVPNRNHRSAAVLLLGFEYIYWLIALFAGFVTFLMADIIVNHWLNLGDLPAMLGRYAIYGAAAIFTLQLPGSVYRSLLVGAQAQVSLNSVMFTSTLVRHGGGVLIVTVWPTLTVYLAWQCSIALLETLVRARLAWGALNVKRRQVNWESNEIKPVWTWVAGMSASTCLGALTVQMDKIVLSKMVPIDQFGYYVVATTVAVGMLQIIYPVVQAVLPRAIQLRSSHVELYRLYIKTACSIGMVVLLAILVYVVAGQWLLAIWLRNPHTVDIIYPILTILLVGTGLNAFYNVGYVNWIVHGKIRQVLRVNILSLILSIVLIPLLVAWKGTIGAAVGWLTINFIGFMLSLDWIKFKTPNAVDS